MVCNQTKSTSPSHSYTYGIYLAPPRLRVPNGHMCGWMCFFCRCVGGCVSSAGLGWIKVKGNSSVTSQLNKKLDAITFAVREQNK